MQEMISKQQNISEPLLKAVYNLGPNNLVKIEPGTVCRKAQIENSKAPRLYANLNCI